MRSTTFLYNPAIDHGAPTHWGVLAGQFSQPSAYEVHRPRGTHDWLLTFTLSGQGGFSIDGEMVQVESNDLALLAPGCPHHYGTIGDSWEFFWVHFIPQQPWMVWLNAIENRNRFSLWRLRDKTLVRRVLAAFDRLVVDSSGLGIHEHALATNAVEELLILLAAFIERQPRQLDDRIQQVLIILSEHYTASVDISDLAKQVGLSASRLSHLFKAETGSSIIETLQQIRLRHAARLLDRTDLSITEISDAVGFASPYYFSRQFRRHYGVAPTEYRRQTKGLRG